MTELSTETDDRTASALATRSPSAVKTHHPRRFLPGHGAVPAARPNPEPAQSVPLISQGEDLWDEGRLAARSGNYERAIACFVREAEARSEEGSHGRAAIAFRTAAEQARSQGLAEQGDQLLNRAATAYTHVATGNGLAPVTAHQAWISAAKCFLQLQPLDRAASCIEEARRVAAGALGSPEPARTAS